MAAIKQMPPIAIDPEQSLQCMAAPDSKLRKKLNTGSGQAQVDGRACVPNSAVAVRLQCHVSRILSRSGANATARDDAADLTRS
jgi:hypothetical protein